MCENGLKRISEQELRKIQIEILDEVDNFCRGIMQSIIGLIAVLYSVQLDTRDTFRGMMILTWECSEMIITIR